MPNYTILFDTETTGLLKPEINRLDAQPYIVSLYAVKIDDDFNMVGEISILVKPPILIPAEASKVHGISDDMVKDCEPFGNAVEELADFFLGVKTMVAHNLPYDRSMLANELLRCDSVLKFPWPPNHICTVEKSMWVEQRRMSLSALHEHITGKPHLDAHSAKGDVYALVRCYHWLCEQGHNWRHEEGKKV